MPGSRTAAINLKPGEDANQSAAAHLAHPETLFGTNRDDLASLQDFKARSSTNLAPSTDPKNTTFEHLKGADRRYGEPTLQDEHEEDRITASEYLGI